MEPIASAGAPLGASRSVMIMLHGRNAGPQNILELVPRLDRHAFSYLAPAADNNTWYPYSFLVEIEKNEPHLSAALQTIERVIDDVAARGITRERIFLLGFSQGACLAAEFAMRHAARYGGIIIYSGGLMGPPGTTWHRNGSFAGTPVFLGCSDVDAHIPERRVDESAETFTQMGAEVTKRIYPGMGHLVNDDEIAFAQSIMDRVQAHPPSPG